MNFIDLPHRDYDEAVGQPLRAFLEQCQRETPLLRLTSSNPEKNILLVTAPEDVFGVVANADNFSSTNHPQSRRYDSDYNEETACIYAKSNLNLKNVIVWSDGPYHARVRKLIQFAFSSAKVAAKTQYIQAFIDELLGDISGRTEFVESFSHRLPSMVITREFGLKPEDVPLMMKVTDVVSVMTDALGPRDGTQSAAPVIIELQKLLLERLESGHLPADCMLLDLANAQSADEPVLSRDELMWLASLLLAAGGHTTGAMLGWGAYMLAARPDI